MRPESDSKCQNRSQVQLNSLDTDLINSINNYANTYKSQIETNFSQTQITNQIINFEKNKTKKIKQNYISMKLKIKLMKMQILYQLFVKRI